MKINATPLTNAEIDAAYKANLGLLDVPPSEWTGTWAKFRPVPRKAAAPVAPVQTSAWVGIAKDILAAALLAAIGFAMFLPGLSALGD